MALAATTALAAPTITVKDGVTRVANGPKPSGGVEVVTLKEAWRVGGDEGEEFFGHLVFMPDGTLGLAQVFPGRIVKINLDGSPGVASGADLVVTAEAIAQDGATAQDRTNYVATVDVAHRTGHRHDRDR